MLDHICLLIIIIGLVVLICLPWNAERDAGVTRLLRAAVIVATVLWAIIEIIGYLPTR